MPRRIYTYEPGRGWEIWNLIVTIGVVFQIAGVLVFVFNLLRSLVKGEAAGERSLGRVDARVVHEFAPARIQLRQDSRCQKPASTLGHQASGRSGLEVRIDRRTRLSSAAITRPSIEPEWVLPSRGRVGMFSLIAAEAAIFTIFVVAYIFYIGQEPVGSHAKGRARTSDL